MCLDTDYRADVSSCGEVFLLIFRNQGRLLKLVDRADLGSVGASHESSSLSPPTGLHHSRGIIQRGE